MPAAVVRYYFVRSTCLYSYLSGHTITILDESVFSSDPSVKWSIDIIVRNLGIAGGYVWLVYYVRGEVVTGLRSCVDAFARSS